MWWVRFGWIGRHRRLRTPYCRFAIMGAKELRQLLHDQWLLHRLGGLLRTAFAARRIASSGMEGRLLGWRLFALLPSRFLERA